MHQTDHPDWRALYAILVAHGKNTPEVDAAIARLEDAEQELASKQADLAIVLRITVTRVQFAYEHPKGGKEGNRYSKPLDWFRTNMEGGA